MLSRGWSSTCPLQSQLHPDTAVRFAILSYVTWAMGSFPPNSAAIIKPPDSPWGALNSDHYLPLLRVSATRPCIFSLDFAVPSAEFREAVPAMPGAEAMWMLPIAMAARQGRGKGAPTAKGRHAPGQSAGNCRGREAGQRVSKSHRHVFKLISPGRYRRGHPCPSYGITQTHLVWQPSKPAAAAAVNPVAPTENSDRSRPAGGSCTLLWGLPY